MVDKFYRAFEERHRGSRELIKGRLQVYLQFVDSLLAIYPDAVTLDVGCGRGEWLEILRDRGFDALGVDLDEGMLKACRELGLSVRRGDAIEYLRTLPADHLSVISALHVVEHITFEKLRTLVSEALRVLKPGGLLIMETPNPENITVATNGFYLDPTHTRPIPKELLSFLPEFYGFARTKILRLQESIELSKSESPTLNDVLRGASPDYAVVAQKLAKPAILKKFDEPFGKDFGLPLQTLATRHDAANLTRIEGLEASVDSQLNAWKSRIDHLEADVSEARSIARNVDQQKLEHSRLTDALIREKELNVESQGVAGRLFLDMHERSRAMLQKVLSDTAEREWRTEKSTEERLSTLQSNAEKLREDLLKEKESKLESQRAATDAVYSAYQYSHDSLQSVIHAFSNREKELEGISAYLGNCVQTLAEALVLAKESTVDSERELRTALREVHERARADVVTLYENVTQGQRHFAETLNEFRISSDAERRAMQQESESTNAQLAQQKEDLERTRAHFAEEQKNNSEEQKKALAQYHVAVEDTGRKFAALDARQTGTEERLINSLLALSAEQIEARRELEARMDEMRSLTLAVVESQKSINNFVNRPFKSILRSFFKADLVVDAETLGNAAVDQPRSEIIVVAGQPGEGIVECQRVEVENFEKEEDGRGYAMREIKSTSDLLELNDEAFIKASYRSLLGREADPTGVSYYINRLKSGYSKGSIVSQLMASEEARSFNTSLSGVKDVVKQERLSRRWIRGYFLRRSLRSQKLQRLENNIGSIMSKLSAVEASSKKIENDLALIAVKIVQFNSAISSVNAVSQSLARVGVSSDTAVQAASLPSMPALLQGGGELEFLSNSEAVARVRDLIANGS